MYMLLTPVNKKCFYVYLFLAIFFSSVINHLNSCVYAQVNEEDPVSNIIEKTSAVFINSEIVEVIKVRTSEEELLSNVSIDVTVEDPDIATIRVLDPSDGDQVEAEGEILKVQTRENGQKAFLIKGESFGTTKIKFEINNEDDTESESVIEELTVSVIDLEAKIQVDKKLGEAPLTVQFFDRSSGNADTIEWDFGDDDIVISTERNPEHTFEKSGIFDVTLELTQSTAIGTVTQKETVSICVSPANSNLPGVIFGTIFDPVTNTPVRRAEVTLITGQGERLQRTGRNGVYRFEDVLPGMVTFSICKLPFFECLLDENVEYNGGSLSKNFNLMRRDSTPQPQ